MFKLVKDFITFLLGLQPLEWCSVYRLSSIFFTCDLNKCPDITLKDIDTTSLTSKRANLFLNGQNEEIKVNKDASTDGSSVEIDRVNEEEPSGLSTSQMKILEQLLGSSDGGLSEILNAIDGVSDTHGRILIMTTNRKYALDDALLRPGRIDLSIEVGYVTPDVFRQFAKVFFPDKELPKHFLVKGKTTVAELQQKVLEKRSWEEIIKDCINSDLEERMVAGLNVAYKVSEDLDKHTTKL